MDKIFLPKVFPVTCHTDYVGPGSTFVVIKGMEQDGACYVQQALDCGARTIVIPEGSDFSEDVKQTIKRLNIVVKYSDNPRKTVADLSAQAAGYPARKLRIIGVTGTKGKTTTCWILEHILRMAGYKTALLGTVCNRLIDAIFPSKLTTPQPDYLHQFFKVCVEQGVEYVVMEVAAQALSLHRVEGILFDGIIFTNIGQEHAEFYETPHHYAAAKIKIFRQAKKDAPIIVNIDDSLGKVIATMHDGFTTTSIYDKEAMIQGVIAQYSINMYTCRIGTKVFSYPHLIGDFNGYNVLAAIVMSRSIGLSDLAIIKSLRSFPGVPGRQEIYRLHNGARVIIDYAHTPESFKALFVLIRTWTKDLIVVFGAGGGRDHQKRPMMGHIASEYADKVILTSDNPRNEDMMSIVNMIKSGINSCNRKKISIFLDRKDAIEYACKKAKDESIILLLGKGPDTYQEIQGKKVVFDEKKIIEPYT